MDLYVIRNKKQLLDLTELMNNMRLPFKVAFQSIFPVRSLDMNAYYFGVVCKYIADVTGQSVEEVHEGYKKRFNYKGDFEYNPKKGQYKFVFGVKSTASLDEKEFIDYVMKVRCDSEIDLHIIIPLPSETFINELKFENEQRRL